MFKLATLKSKTFWASVALGVWQGIATGLELSSETKQTGDALLVALIGMFLADRQTKSIPPVPPVK